MTVPADGSGVIRIVGSRRVLVHRFMCHLKGTHQRGHTDGKTLWWWGQPVAQWQAGTPVLLIVGEPPEPEILGITGELKACGLE